MCSSIRQLSILPVSPTLSVKPLALENSKLHVRSTSTVKVIDMRSRLSDSEREKRSLEMTTDGVVAALLASCSLMDGFERRGFTQRYAIGGPNIDFPPSLHLSDVTL